MGAAGCYMSLLRKPVRKLIREVAAQEREGINPSPTTKTEGAGFTPARPVSCFAPRRDEHVSEFCMRLT